MTRSPLPPRPEPAAPAAFAVVPIQGRGMGWRALRTIKRGERLLAEAPLVVVAGNTVKASSIEAQLESLSPVQRDVWDGLAQDAAKYGYIKSVRGTFFVCACCAFEAVVQRTKLAGVLTRFACVDAQTNAMGFEDENGELLNAIFPVASRLNHCCEPNAVYKFNPTLGAVTIHASCPIPYGEEVTIHYLGDSGGQPREARRRRLKASWGFDCDCAKCSLSGQALCESEERLAKIGVPADLPETLWATASGGEESPKTILSRIAAHVELIRQESPNGSHPGLEVFFERFAAMCDALARRTLQAADSRTDSRACSRVAEDENARVAAETFAKAALQYSNLAMEETRALKGEDHPAYAFWLDHLRNREVSPRGSRRGGSVCGSYVT